MFSYLDAEPLEDIETSNVERLVDLLKELGQRETALENFNLPRASASRACLRHYPEAVETRLNKILGCKGAEWEESVSALINQEFMPLWLQVLDSFNKAMDRERTDPDKILG